MTPKELDAICKVLRKNGVRYYDCGDFEVRFHAPDATPLGAVPRQRMVIDPDDLDGGPLPAEPGDEDTDPTVPPT